jgi:hypothetical protein
LRTDFICPFGIEIAQADGANQPFTLKVLEDLEGSEISFIGIILPVKLREGYIERKWRVLRPD